MELEQPQLRQGRKKMAPPLSQTPSNVSKDQAIFVKAEVKLSEVKTAKKNLFDVKALA